MKKIAALLLVAGLAGAAAPVEAGEATAAGKQRLRAFGSCGQLLAYAKKHGTRTVGPWGFGGPVGIATPETAAGAGDTSRSAAPASSSDYSSTNVQEEGVDEPDIVKTDGERIVAIAQSSLRYVDLTGVKPQLRDSLPLSDTFQHELLVEGDRALVISRGAGGGGIPGPATDRIGPAYAEKTVLTEVDLSHPGALRVVRTLTVDGWYVSARLTGSAARVVLRTSPAIKIDPPPPGTTDPGAAEASNRRAVQRTRLGNWLPRYELRNRRTGAVKRRYLANCRSVRHPAKFSGLGLVTVLTLDLSKSIEPVDSDSVMSNADIVYASTDTLYVATQRWIEPEKMAAGKEPPRVETALHAFAAPRTPVTSYRATGTVPGYLLNQWSLSEHDGKLRVASTTMPLWWPTGGGPEGESESMVTVLERRGESLTRIGHVGGLGKNERVYGVRFMGDVGYVVTFRQVDPLYTLDLSTPAKPVVRGELKILGYSAYLHPVGEDLLLGVGQDATAEGRALGTMVSLFDVSDLRNPKRLDRLTIAGAHSESEFDHHAFLYWPKTRLAVVPLQIYPQARGGKVFSGALGVSVSRARGVTKVGDVEHGANAPIRRSLVVGGTLYTLSDSGLRASDLDTLADRSWLAF